ncbi:GNAT family N-acetyltransferase [Labrenzia sp. OB1]|uniref:GNAT family N-acetyltransferase n=1 Tax=Labrenzia sp. OB1 TaxID=1561204 RepID=UPI000838AC6A|nr:GNAT family N-acetyltransferase [Labrenzia sp. OB1]
MNYKFHAVASEKDWSRLHDIRRTVLFAPGRHSVEYNENHPEDRKDGNIPYLLDLDDRAFGVVRIDYKGSVAVVRLVAIAATEQGNGHGRQLNAMIEAEAKKHGVETLRVNAAPGAVGYYEKMDWKQAIWDANELVGLASNCVQMSKKI